MRPRAFTVFIRTVLESRFVDRRSYGAHGRHGTVDRPGNIDRTPV